MNIKLLGTGCPNCKRLEANVLQAVAESGKMAKIEKVTDIEEIMSYGVMSTPALVIDGEVKSYGRVNSLLEIKEMLE